MKKLFTALIAASVLSGLYAVNLGVGVASQNVLKDGRYFAVKADLSTPVMPIIDWRVGILNVVLPDGGKAIHFGTGVSSDLLIKVPMPMAFQPYIVLGLWYDMGLEDAPLDIMEINVKAALGGQMGFGGMNGYLEFGFDEFNWTKGADPATSQEFYGQLGVRIPLKLGL